jgi:predicted TIM-barrel fold metal-dependent hydrolase
MIRRMAAADQIVAVALFPSGLLPPLAPDSPQIYPIHAVCCELGLPILVNVGVPGPRFPMASQHVKALDRVCYDFPELRIVTRHGGEPWEELLVKLMLKWPNLHYSTSAFAPKYYPQAIVDYANTRGADRILYAGYFPSGLSLERIFAELPDVGFRDGVWPAFLRTNAMRVFGLDGRS